MCLRFVFLLITGLAAWLRLSRREETWKTAEILNLRHQFAVLQRRLRAARLWTGGPGTVRNPAGCDTESAANAVRAAPPYTTLPNAVSEPGGPQGTRGVRLGWEPVGGRPRRGTCYP